MWDYRISELLKEARNSDKGRQQPLELTLEAPRPQAVTEDETSEGGVVVIDIL